MQRVHLVIHGRVIMVGFRYFIRNKALFLGLNGWVRNINDKVEAVFEGQQDKLNRMIEICEDGPIMSRVDKVDIKYETPENLKGFEIK
ncbi:acylphosphatase [Candidatus Woesearchaeota archaeon]|nr:acylphosphatase [Candidatus Woesearchaeota archaeon]